MCPSLQNSEKRILTNEFEHGSRKKNLFGRQLGRFFLARTFLQNLAVDGDDLIHKQK